MLSSFLFSWANLVRAAMGSVPGRTNIRGVELIESLKERSRLKWGGSMKLCPKLPIM